MAASVVAIGLLLAGTVAQVGAHADVRQPAVTARAAVPAPALAPGDEAGARVGRDGVSIVPPRPAMPTAMLVFGVCLTVVVLTLTRRRPHMLAVLALALLLTIVGFESGVHAVHHLGDPAGATQCGVASVTSQLSGTAEPPHTDAPDLGLSTHHVAVAEQLPLGTRPLDPQQGRAPPSLAS